LVHSCNQLDHDFISRLLCVAGLRRCPRQLPVGLALFSTNGPCCRYLGSLGQLGLFVCKMLLAVFRNELALHRESVHLSVRGSGTGAGQILNIRDGVSSV